MAIIELECEFSYFQKGWGDLIFCEGIKSGRNNWENDTCLYQTKNGQITSQKCCKHYKENPKEKVRV